MADAAFIIHPYLNKAETDLHDEEYRAQEANELARAISLKVGHSLMISLRNHTPSTYIGKGKIEDIKALIEAAEEKDKAPAVIIMNCALTPVQQRNLEKAWRVKVIDRTGLILEIFGERAKTKEGQLQVELAALDYQKSRLVRSWTHLERQRGGAGFMGGPGESQIEIDRRLISERIVKIKEDIDKIRRNRDLQKKAREQIPYPMIAIVGYTNAGKSTLFNRMTNSKILAKDMLFATLDTTMRKLPLPSGIDAILSDTVGFISDLPTHLIAAFRATLEQLNYADIILHVQDISSPSHQSQRSNVEEILKSFNIAPDANHILHIFNKIDLLDADDRRDYLKFVRPHEVYCSALTGQGVETIGEVIDTLLQEDYNHVKLSLQATQGRAIAWLHGHADIIAQDIHDNTITLEFKIHPREWGKFRRLFEGEGYEILSNSE